MIYNKVSDQWETPQWLYDELNKEFNFEYDICANEHNHKATNWSIDYLEDEINDVIYCNSAFMNPPYSNPRPFIEKAWEDSRYCKIVCLVKCDPSTKWWATFWDYKVTCPWCDGTAGPCQYYADIVVPCHKCYDSGTYYGPKPGCEVRFLPKRLKFEFDGVPSKHSANFPSAILIFDRRGL